MKNFIIPLLVLAFTVSACRKEEDNSEVSQKENIPFVGKWQRQFEAGPGNLHSVSYNIYQDSMRYTLSGPVGNADYKIIRDTFLTENNRFIGHTSTGVYYLIFTKQLSTNAIKLYKEEVANVNEGLQKDVPDENNTENHGWNVYNKE